MKLGSEFHFFISVCYEFLSFSTATFFLVKFFQERGLLVDDRVDQGVWRYIMLELLHMLASITPLPHILKCLAMNVLMVLIYF